MAPVFVFVKEVEKLLEEGKQEILVPEGAKISPAALDLIQERGIRIVRGGAGEPPLEAPEGPGDEKPPPQASPEEAESGSISEEELETIVDRVIRRLRQAKGEPVLETGVDRRPAHDDDMIICRCEEITKGEIKEAIRTGMHSLHGIKRVTRAGMGLCQGQTCQRLVGQILASELGLPPSEIEPDTARAPVRPVRLSVFATG